MKHVTSRDNALLRRVRRLATSARERRESGLTLLDGVHLVEAAEAAGVVLQELLVSEHGVQQPEIDALLARHPEAAVTLVPDALFAQASPVDTPSGVLALIATPPETGASLSPSVIVLDGVQDPGNLGTIVRTAAAAGVGDALLTTGCAQAWAPRTLRAGMGGHFRLRIRERVDASTALADFQGRIVATGVGADARSLYETELTGAVAWLFGAEGAGLSPAVAALATDVVTIPMPGDVESLNVGAAAAVCLFEQVRQRLGLPVSR